MHGLIITAHCDLAQSKTPIINYLPVVPLEDWTLRDLAPILLEYQVNEQELALKRLLEQNSVSSTLLITQPMRTIIDTFFPDSPTAKPKEKAIRSKALGYEAALALCRSLSEKPCFTNAEFSEISALNTKARDRFLEDCMKQKLGGYYFLAGVDPDGEHTGYVVLLRQIYHLPAEVANAIANGLEYTEYSQLLTRRSDFLLNLSAGEMAMPVAQVKSPYLEHLMQAFANLYTRIGVSDLHENYIDHLKTRKAGGAR